MGMQDHVALGQAVPIIPRVRGSPIELTPRGSLVHKSK